MSPQQYMKYTSRPKYFKSTRNWNRLLRNLSAIQRANCQSSQVTFRNKVIDINRASGIRLGLACPVIAVSSVLTSWRQCLNTALHLSFLENQRCWEDDTARSRNNTDEENPKKNSIDYHGNVFPILRDLCVCVFVPHVISDKFDSFARVP